MSNPARPVRAGQLIAVATFVALVAGIVAPDLVAARRRASVEIISTRTVATPSEYQVVICADEKYTVELTVEEEVVYRWANDPPGVTHTSHRPLSRGVTVSASAAHEASVSPGSARIRPPRSAATFDITGLEPGVGSLSFSVPGSNVNPGISVTVQECEYEIHVSSHWYIGRGFRPDMFSTLSRLRLKRIRKNVYIGTGNMHNSGYGTPIGGCTPVITVPDTQVIVRGDIVQGQYRPEIKLNISYSPVPAGMAVTCPPAGTGTSSDTAHIQFIDTNLKAFEFLDSKYVPGHVAESKLGSATSNTFIALTLIRP